VVGAIVPWNWPFNMAIGDTLNPDTEMGPEQLEYFLETKAVWIQL
jgi:acyl-CoA reductase-like NAD-dependent aldehyde dehydrogenase